MFLTYRAGQEQRKQELRLEEVRLRKEFLIEQYRHRLSTYSQVLRSLVVISDVSLGDDDDRYEPLLAKPESLRSATTELYEHLYGEAGLLMTMETRNWIHVARQEALRFLSGPATPEAGDRLVNAFYWARRALRSDLAEQDDQEPDSVETLAARLSQGGPGSPKGG
jgi:hypothetical protein